eukprot:scaffold28948_cov31-Attheya_sp.AAC.1
MALTPHTARPLQQGDLAANSTWGHHGQVAQMLFVRAANEQEECIDIPSLGEMMMTISWTRTKL